jgi:hypothetical protein
MAALWTLAAAAQTGSEGVRSALERSDFQGPSARARVEVIITPDAAGAIRAADLATPSKSTVAVYGVRLMSDSSQEGRANANAAAARFREMYPEIEAEVSYESPTFRVTAGCFIDQLDAVALCGRVVSMFRTAFVVRMTKSTADIIAQEKFTPPTPAEE